MKIGRCPFCEGGTLAAGRGECVCIRCGVEWRDGVIRESTSLPRPGGWNDVPEGTLTVRREQVEA